MTACCHGAIFAFLTLFVAVWLLLERSVTVLLFVTCTLLSNCAHAAWQSSCLSMMKNDEVLITQKKAEPALPNCQSMGVSSRVLPESNWQDRVPSLSRWNVLSSCIEGASTLQSRVLCWARDEQLPSMPCWVLLRKPILDVPCVQRWSSVPNRANISDYDGQC